MSQRIDMIRFFIAGAEAVLGEIGNGEECQEALHTIKRDLETITELRSLKEQSVSSLEYARDVYRKSIEAMQQQCNDDIAAAYARGLDEAKAEAAQEKVNSIDRGMIAMLGYETIMLCTKSGHAPFLFAPHYVTTFHHYCMVTDSTQMHDTLKSETVGIVGINRVTLGLIFVPTWDSWTLAPRDAVN